MTGVDLTETVRGGEAIVQAIDNAVVERRHNEEQERTYLGASIIGDSCDRKLWYLFRWAFEPEVFDGRKLRLFETGHLEEDRMIGWLRAAGIHVDALDPETGEQFAISDVGGHFRGHLDGEAVGVFQAPATVHVLECKTHNEDSFKGLSRRGVEVEHPKHESQMQVYMHKRGRTRSLYIAKCKNDDALYVERVRYDPEKAMRLIAKAERIVTTDSAPAKYSDDPDNFVCRLCSRREGCHSGLWARRNCRTCLHSTPTMGGDGEWRCALHDVVLDTPTQRLGCGDHLYLPDLVPGEITDLDEALQTITYALRDGSTWTDGRAA